MEIEKKYILKNLPNTLILKKKNKIKQGYIIAIPNGIEIRLRKYGRSYFQTIKSADLVIREETEIKLTKRQFDALWPYTKGKRIDKIRFTFAYSKYDLEVDTYLGRLKGLKIAEIEFKSIEECESFIPPDWIGADITEDPLFKNRNLAG